MDRPICTSAALLAGLLCGWPAGGGAETGTMTRMASGQPAFILNITGSNDTVAFSGACWLQQADGSERRIHLEGTVPQRHELQGTGLRCDFVQESALGALTVEITGGAGRNRSRSRSQGAGSRIRVQMQ